MYDLGKDEIPAEVMEKGRRIPEILALFKRFHEGAEEVAKLTDVSDDKAERMIACAVYRVYALGFEDGMNAHKTGKRGVLAQ